MYNSIFTDDTIIRCDAKPDDLDAEGAHRRSHEKTDFMIRNFDPGILWDDYGIRSDVVVRALISFSKF